MTFYVITAIVVAVVVMIVGLVRSSVMYLDKNNRIHYEDNFHLLVGTALSFLVGALAGLIWPFVILVFVVFCVVRVFIEAHKRDTGNW